MHQRPTIHRADLQQGSVRRGERRKLMTHSSSLPAECTMYRHFDTVLAVIQWSYSLRSHHPQTWRNFQPEWFVETRGWVMRSRSGSFANPHASDVIFEPGDLLACKLVAHAKQTFGQRGCRNGELFRHEERFRVALSAGTPSPHCLHGKDN